MGGGDVTGLEGGLLESGGGSTGFGGRGRSVPLLILQLTRGVTSLGWKLGQLLTSLSWERGKVMSRGLGLQKLPGRGVLTSLGLGVKGEVNLLGGTRRREPQGQLLRGCRSLSVR